MYVRINLFAKIHMLQNKKYDPQTRLGLYSGDQKIYTTADRGSTGDKECG
jgi:hypothetical protein